MKNKKADVCEWLMTYGWAILVAVVAIGVLAYYGVFSQEPHYIIEKEECWNQTIVLGEKLIKQEIKNCKMIKVYDSDDKIREKGCYDDPLMEYFKKNYPCNELRCNFFISNEKGHAIYVPAFIEVISNETYIYEDWKSITKEKEICKKVEVDEIEIYKSCSSENWDDPDYPVGICFDLYTKKISPTIEWFEENCEVTKVYSKLSNKEYPCNSTSCSEDICQSKDYKCLEYKCGEYYVKKWEQIK